MPKPTFSVLSSVVLERCSAVLTAMTDVCVFIDVQVDWYWLWTYLACMRIFITSVGQAIAEDTLPDMIVCLTSHLNFGSQSKSNFKGLSVTRKNSTEKPEQGWLFWKAETGLQPVFAGVVEAIPGCAFSCNATSTLTVCKSLRPKPVSHQILSPHGNWKMKSDHTWCSHRQPV